MHLVGVIIKKFVTMRGHVNVKFFHVVFVHLVCNSELILASCGFPFLLLVVANLICIFLVSSQLDLLSALTEFLHSFCDQKLCPQLIFRKLSSRLMLIFFYPLVLYSKFRSKKWVKHLCYSCTLFHLRMSYL